MSSAFFKIFMNNPWPPNLASRCIYKNLLKWHSSSLCWWRHHIKITWQTKNKHYISTTRVPMTTKLARMVTNPEELLPMLLDPLVTWSWKVMWQTKTIISILTQCLQPPILGGVWLTTRVLPIKSRKILWSRGHARSPKTILYPLYLWP